MERPIIHIDEEKCDGCGQCVLDCAEGALAVIDGKARLISEVYCDGLGACLNCPREALTLITREAPEYDEEAALAAKAIRDARAGLKAEFEAGPAGARQRGCPSSQARMLQTSAQAAPGHGRAGSLSGSQPLSAAGPRPGRPLNSLTPVSTPDSLRVQLPTWPIQLQLINAQAPFLKGAHILLAAHCAGFSLPNLHTDWIAGRVPVIACPKLDDGDKLLSRLTALIRDGGIARLTILRMSVPCCGGLEQLVRRALQAAGSDLVPQCHVAQLP